MAQYHRLAVVNILSFKSFISESCPLFLELLSFKSFEAECDAWSCLTEVFSMYRAKLNFGLKIHVSLVTGYTSC